MSPTSPPGPFGIGPGTWVNVSVVVGLVSVLIALAIVVKAVRGYRQRGSTPMLLLAVGLVFLTLVPPLYRFVLVLWIGDPSSGSEALLVEIGEDLFQLVGLVSILASLYVER